jgi:hypothetical protein
MAKRRKIKRNPELLILNPQKDSRAVAWRKLRQTYPIEEAIQYYEEIYPDSVRTVKRNKGNGIPAEIKNHPDFAKGEKIHEDFHGIPVQKVTVVDVPSLPGDEPIVLVALGGAPSDSYIADEAVPGSEKSGIIYVHPYEGDDLPLKAVTADGKTLVTLPVTARNKKKSKHKVKDGWITG